MTKIYLKTIIFFILITLMLPGTTEAETTYKRSPQTKTSDARIYTIFNKTLLHFKSNPTLEPYAQQIEENVSKNTIILSVDYEADSPKGFNEYVKFFCNMVPSKNYPSVVQFHHSFPDLYNKHPGLAMALLTHELSMFCFYLKDKAFFTNKIEDPVEDFMFSMDAYNIESNFLEGLYDDKPSLLATKTQYEDLLILSKKEDNLAVVAQTFLHTDKIITYTLYSSRDDNKPFKKVIDTFKKMEAKAINQLHYPEEDKLSNYINIIPAYTLVNLGPNLLACAYFSKEPAAETFDIKKFPELEKSLNNLHKELEPYKSRLSYQETFKKMIEQDVHR